MLITCFLLYLLQDNGSGEGQMLCVRSRSAFEQQHHHLLHCLEKTTVRPNERLHCQEGGGLPDTKLFPSLRWKLKHLIVEIA